MMNNNKEAKPLYDLENRTYEFSKKVALFCRKLPKTTINSQYVPQLIKASSSVGANYIEANESLSKKDFAMRIKISRKESKESIYWLRLLNGTNDSRFSQEINVLLNEAVELKKILSSILKKTA